MQYLGIDIGSVSIKYAIIDEENNVLEENYMRTHGDSVTAAKKMLENIQISEIDGIATTGSGRKFIKSLIDGDLDFDEITAHRTAISRMYPTVRTIFEIGGQDSKLIYFSDTMVNFEMNHVCAAGTGSFLDQQASRLNLSIQDFCSKGMETEDSHKIASKCTVFAESDMIHAQQSGIPIDKIIRGVHRGLINNYFSQLCRGKKLQGDFLFEGGTSENHLLIDEFKKKLVEDELIVEYQEFIVPTPYNKVIGAIGAAILCKEKQIKKRRSIPQINEFEFIDSGECYACANKCGAKITTVKINNKTLTLGRSCQN